MFMVFAVLAALSFSVGGYFMKLSDGLRRPVPTTAVFALFVAGAALQTLAMRGAPMTATYVIVLGLEAILAYLLGACFLGEGSSIEKIFGIGLVVAGIALLRFGRT
jgi:multidrug transporter EmrE-like cation transporter